MKGGAPGQVTYSGEKVLSIRVEPERLERLQRSRERAGDAEGRRARASPGPGSDPGGSGLLGRRRHSTPQLEQLPDEDLRQGHHRHRQHRAHDAQQLGEEEHAEEG